MMVWQQDALRTAQRATNSLRQLADAMTKIADAQEPPPAVIHDTDPAVLEEVWIKREPSEIILVDTGSIHSRFVELTDVERDNRYVWLFTAVDGDVVEVDGGKEETVMWLKARVES